MGLCSSKETEDPPNQKGAPIIINSFPKPATILQPIKTSSLLKNRRSQSFDSSDESDEDYTGVRLEDISPIQVSAEVHSLRQGFGSLYSADEVEHGKKLMSPWNNNSNSKQSEISLDHCEEEEDEEEEDDLDEIYENEKPKIKVMQN